MKINDRIAALFLAIGLAVLPACSFSQEPKDSTSTQTQEDPNASFGVSLPWGQGILVRESGSGDAVVKAVSELNQVISATAFGKTIPSVEDISPTENGKFEILIGSTNRSASDLAAAQLEGEEFAYTIIRNGNKIAILGTDENLTAQGVRYFSEILRKNTDADGVLQLETDYVYTRLIDSVTFYDGKQSDYRLVYPCIDLLNDTCIQQSKELQTFLEKTTGKKPVAISDATDPDAARSATSKEILLSATYYSETASLLSELTYREYGVKIIGSKVVIYGFTEQALKAAVNLFETLVKQYTVGKKVIFPEDLTVKGGDSSYRMSMPCYPDISQLLIPCEGDTYMVYVKNCDSSDFRDYLRLLDRSGFVCYTTNEIAGNLFATYTDRKTVVNCQYDKTDGTIRIVQDFNANLPPRAGDSAGGTLPTLLTQVGLSYLKEGTGMSYFVRLDDGRFLVIDGGYNDFDEEERLYDSLMAQNPAGEKPVIAAWFISHVHADHYGNFLSFCQRYLGKVVIQSVVYNFTTPEIGTYVNSEIAGNTKRVDACIQSLPGTKIIYARTGQKFCYGDVTVEVLYTPEDTYPGKIQIVNDSSVVLRMTCRNQTTLFLADVEKATADLLCRRYGNTLKSDIMQVAHHSYWGGSDELYRLVDASTLLWPCPEHWYWEMRKETINQYLVTSPNVVEVFNAGNGSVTLTLPYTPHKAEAKTYHAGETVLANDLQSCKYYGDAGVYTVDTNKGVNEEPVHQYAEMSWVTESGKKALRMNGYQYSVVGLIRHGVMKDLPIFTLQLDLTVNNLGEGFGIWYNDDVPNDSANRCLFSVDRTGSYTLTLEVNRTAGTTTVYYNGVSAKTVTNSSNDAGALILLLKMNSDVILRGYRLTAGTFADL